jgi:hypothetical protein
VHEIARIEVRSYRTVFDLERRVYRIDRIRLNPSGVPVRGVVYAVVVALVVAALGAMPVAGVPARQLPWPVSHLLVPVVLAAALTAVRIDGRPCHVALRSLAAFACGPRRVSCWQRATSLPRVWRPPDLLLIPDGSDSSFRRAHFRGPGAVAVAVGHELRQRRGRRMSLCQAQGTEPGRRVIALAPGGRLDIEPGRR